MQTRNGSDSGTTRFARGVCFAALIALAACKGSPTEPVANSTIASVAAGVAQAAAAVTGQSAPLATAYAKGTFVGFDTHTYPGDGVMRTWKKTPGSPYTWVGDYLPSPCHADKSWVGKRQTLRSMGWGIAIVYVGQQTWGKTPKKLSASALTALRKRSDCSADLVNASQGTLEADDATARATAEGFPRGDIVFLDLERMENIPPAMRDYYRAWAARMLSRGVYRPGVYTHEHNAPQVFADLKQVFTAAGDTETPRMWVAGGKGFDEGKAPQDVGYTFAGMWQGVIDVARSVANVKLPVDLNVASWMSPSESGVQPGL
jgi:hypothetical protein